MENKLNNFLDQEKKNLAEHGKIRMNIKAMTSAPKTLWHEFLPTNPPTIKLKVKAIPEKGKANKIIEKFVGKYFKGRAEILVGETSSLKIIEVRK